MLHKNIELRFVLPPLLWGIYLVLISSQVVNADEVVRTARALMDRTPAYSQFQEKIKSLKPLSKYALLEVGNYNWGGFWGVIVTESPSGMHASSLSWDAKDDSVIVEQDLPRSFESLLSDLKTAGLLSMSDNTKSAHVFDCSTYFITVSTGAESKKLTIYGAELRNDLDAECKLINILLSSCTATGKCRPIPCR